MLETLPWQCLCILWFCWPSCDSQSRSKQPARQTTQWRHQKENCCPFMNTWKHTERMYVTHLEIGAPSLPGRFWPWVQVRGHVFPLPQICTCHQTLFLRDLCWQLTRLLAAGGHQRLQLVAIAAVWRVGWNGEADSPVLRRHNCGVQTSGYLPVWSSDNRGRTQTETIQL